MCVNLKAETPIFGFMAERSGHHLQQTGKEHFFGFDRDGSRLNLREVKNIADQIQQVRARSMNGARVLDLLWRQIVITVVAKLLAENQDAVQRRSQLM